MTNEERKKLDEAVRLVREVEQSMGASVEQLLTVRFDEAKWLAKVDDLAVPNKTRIMDLLRQVASARGPQSALMFASMELGAVTAARAALEELDKPWVPRG